MTNGTRVVITTPWFLESERKGFLASCLQIALPANIMIASMDSYVLKLKLLSVLVDGYSCILGLVIGTQTAFSGKTKPCRSRGNYSWSNGRAGKQSTHIIMQYSCRRRNHRAEKVGNRFVYQIFNSFACPYTLPKARKVLYQRSY